MSDYQPVSTTNPSSPHHSIKPAKKTRWLWWLTLAVLLGGTIWYAIQVQNQNGENTHVLIDRVTRGNIESSITAVGTLKALRSVNVGAQVSGQLKTVKVEVGDKVQEGELIAEIEPLRFEKKVDMSSAQLDNLKAQLISREAQLTLKQLNATRQKSLLASRGVSQSTVDQADADLSAASADVKALMAQIRMQESQLEGDRVDLGYTKIYSPITGTVVDQSAKEGETLNANQTTPTIVTVADLNIMTVEAQVSEADISKLKSGMEVYFTLLGQPDKRYSGTLRQIKPTPEITNNVVLYYALFDVPNPDGNLMINMSAQVYFVIQSAQNVLTAPSSALHEISDKTTVTVVNTSGLQQEKTVEVGIRNRVQAEILSGLEEGDEVAVSGKTDNKNSSRSGGGRTPRMRGLF